MEVNYVEHQGLLTAFLFMLMRDYLPFGYVESILKDLEGVDNANFVYTDAWLGDKANSLAARLVKTEERNGGNS